MIKNKFTKKNISKILFFIALNILLISCTINTPKSSKNLSKNNEIFIGRGVGKTEANAIKNAKKDAIEQIIESMGIDVKIHGELQNFSEEIDSSSFSRTIKKINLKFISKAFLKIKTSNLEVKQINNTNFSAKVWVIFIKKDYQSTYKFYLKNYSKMIVVKTNNYLTLIQTLKLINNIDLKIRNVSGINSLDEWKNYENKKRLFINEYKTKKIQFISEKINSGKSIIKIKSHLKIETGEITLKIGDKLLHKKISNNTFQLEIPQQRVLYVLGNWKNWPKDFERVLILNKKIKKYIRLNYVSKKNQSNFASMLGKELRKKGFEIQFDNNSKSVYELKIKTKIKFFHHNIANYYFAKMNYKIQLIKNRKNILLTLNLDNNEFPTQEISGKDKNEVIKKVQDFKNYLNYKLVLSKIANRINEVLKK